MLYCISFHFPRTEIDGYAVNPQIQVLVDNKIVDSITIPITIAEYEKLLYSSKTGEIYIKRQKLRCYIVYRFIFLVP